MNNAGYNVLAPAETIPLSTAQNIMDTNFWGAVRLTRLALPIMRNQQSGVILQISSTGGRRGFAGNAAYHASKFALEGWTEAVSKEVEEDWNIRFCCAEPGGVKTNYAARSIDPEQQQAAKKEESEAEKAYSNPKSQINMLKAMHENPDVLKNWAEAEKVVEVMYEVIASGDVPLRFPLGIDSWGIQKAGLVSDLQALEKFKEVATSVANNAEEQLKALEGLRV